MKVGVFMNSELKLLEKEMRYLQTKLRLNGWEINLHFVSGEKIEEIMGYYSAGYNAIIYTHMVSDIYIDQDVEDKLTVLSHEMLHLIFYDLNIKFEDMDVCERCVNMINSLVMGLYSKEVGVLQ